MSLTNILTELEKNIPIAQTEVPSEPSTTYRGRIGLKRSAEEVVKRLKLDYRNELMNSTVFIVVTGVAQEQLTSVACGSTFGCFSSDPDSLFSYLASKVNPTLFGREGVRHLFNIAGNVLEDRALELDIASYPMLQFNEKYNTGVNSANELSVLLKRAITDQVGSEIVGINAIHSIVDKAISTKHSAEVTPVVLNTSDEKFALDLYKNLGRLKSKTFLVVAGKPSKALQVVKEAVVVKNVSEDSVGEALATIRNRI